MLHTMSSRLHFLTIIFCAILLLPQTARGEIIVLPVSIDKSIAKAYAAFMADHQVPVTNVNSLRSPHSNRVVASLVILQQALHHGGLTPRLKFVETPNTARARMMVRNGEVVMASQDLWSTAFTDDVYMSSAIIPEGKFFKGIYGLKSNKKLMQVRSLKELRDFTPVCSSSWVVDLKTMHHLRFDYVHNVPRFDLMTNLIRMQKADFILYGFTGNKDMSLKYNGVTLYPVPGIKIALEDSRHFMVSKVHPDGERIYAALERGLAIMREQGTIQRYFKESGFYNQETDDWKLLNP